MRSRAALLPTPCDPFLLKYWIENYKKFWKSEVDKLYVFLNSSIEREVIEYEQELLDSIGANYVYVDHQIEHGDALNRLLEICTEEYIVLVEDDCFVFRKGKINDCFEKIESGDYDCVGGKRGSCAEEISQRARELWGLNYEGYGDQGCNFWPNMFFCKKEVLLKTDRNFGAKQWEPGEFIPALNYTMKEVGCGDTFVNTSLQLRAMGLRFWYENQYHASPYDLEDFQRGRGIFDGLASWTHIGSLSSGVGGDLRDDQGRSLARRNIDNPVNVTSPPGGVDEWARRIQMWQMFYNNSDPEKIPEFREEYRKAIERLYVLCNVPLKIVQRRIACYKTIGL